MNKKEFREITEILEENYNKQMDTRILSLWYEEFKDYPANAYKELVIEIIKTEKSRSDLRTFSQIHLFKEGTVLPIILSNLQKITW